jgi:hypothetical protein
MASVLPCAILPCRLPYGGVLPCGAFLGAGVLSGGLFLVIALLDKLYIVDSRFFHLKGRSD